MRDTFEAKASILTFGLPYMAEKAYGGRLPDEPIENACDTRKRGDMPKTFVKSARRPVNMKLDSRTSFCTSLAMLSTVPGLGRLSNALRSENEVYASLIAAAAGLSVRNERDDARSAILDVGGLEIDEGEMCRHAMPTNGSVAEKDNVGSMRGTKD